MYDVTTMAIPRSDQAINEKVEHYRQEIEKLDDVSEKSKDHINDILERLSSCENPESIAVKTYSKNHNGFSYIDEFNILCIKEAAVYQKMNCFRPYNSL